MPARGSNRAYLRARAHTALASPGVCEHLLDTSPTRFTALGVAGVAGGARSSSRSPRVRIRTTVADRTTAADRSTAQPPRPPPPPLRTRRACVIDATRRALWSRPPLYLRSPLAFPLALQTNMGPASEHSQGDGSPLCVLRSLSTRRRSAPACFVLSEGPGTSVGIRLPAGRACRAPGRG